jgi:SAM-dependent methyltransferase
MDEYQRRLQNEITHYEQIFRGRLSQEVPPVWDAVEARFADLVERATGVRSLYAYVARHVQGREFVRVLGLGSGACGNELDGIAPLLSYRMALTCVDINQSALDTGRAEAEKRSIPFEGIVQDANRISLSKATYDVIVAYAALHHFIELDHIAAEIATALKPDGIFVTVDIPARNGYRMWDETLAVVRGIWGALPAKYKIDHTHFAQPTFVAEYENRDYSVNSFECANSEQILSSLRRHLKEVEFVPALALGRRFFDTRFGPNYDLRETLDRAIFDFVMGIDEYYIASSILRPETFFGAYGQL